MASKLALWLALLCYAVMMAAAIMDEPMMDEEQQDSPSKPKAKMAPEAQRITLESVSAECFDSVYAVVNGEAEQGSLSEACSKEMTDGYNKSPLGQLQQKELVATQVAAVLRLNKPCREEFMKASQPPVEGEDVVQPTESCVDDFQKHYRDMQQWVALATLSRLSADCKKEAQEGSLGAECEAEFVAVKPQIIQTLDNQNEAKSKEPPKEEKKKRNTTESGEPKKKRVKPEPPLIDPSFLFFAVWSVLIGGSVIYTCFWYHNNPKAKEMVEATMPAESPGETKSKTQQKKEARNAKRGVQRRN